MNAKYLTINDHLEILSKRKKVVFLVFAAIFGLVVLITFMTTPLYEGRAQIIIERMAPNNLSDRESMARDPGFEATQYQLLRSHAVSRRVVRILNLEDSFDSLYNPDGPSITTRVKKQISGLMSSLIGLFSPGNEATQNAAQSDKADLVAKKLVENLKIEPVVDSHITIISYRAPNPEFAATVANAYIKAYQEETLEIKMAATRRTLEWMTDKSEKERLKLQETEKQLQRYMEANDLVTLEDRMTILPETLSQLGRDLVSAQIKTKENKVLYDKVRRVSGDLDAAESVLSISEGSSLDVLRAQILKAEQNIMELSSKYGSQHPVMIKAVGDLNVLKKKRRQEIHRIIGKVKSQYELALSNEQSIRAQLNEKKAEAHILNEKYVQYSVLKREIETNRRLFDSLQTKIKDQSITGGTRPVNVWVVENASPSRQPVKPLKGLNIVLGLIIGLIGGVACPYVVDYLDNRIKSSDGLREALDVAVLGSVTHNKNSKAMNEIARTEPRSEFAESYNALRTTLLLSSADAPPKKILVSSSIPGEGKTTTSVNLALTMAKSDSRVVLIDTDLRKPRLHEIFKLNNKVGLSNYLAGGADRSILQRSSQENLVVIPAGTVPPNPYELLNSNRMRSLLQSLESEFDTIICDTPPILSVVDARLLSQNVDGLILVVRAGKTTYPMAQSCIQLLKDVNAKILGVFVNDVLAKDQSYYEYYSSFYAAGSREKAVS